MKNQKTQETAETIPYKSPIRALYERHSSLWQGRRQATITRLDRILSRDEAHGFTIPTRIRSALVSLYNAIDMTCEADRGGCPPYHRLWCLTAVERILEG
jgi:hypothetical protein